MYPHFLPWCMSARLSNQIFFFPCFLNHHPLPIHTRSTGLAIEKLVPDWLCHQLTNGIQRTFMKLNFASVGIQQKSGEQSLSSKTRTLPHHLWRIISCCSWLFLIKSQLWSTVWYNWGWMPINKPPPWNWTLPQKGKSLRLQTYGTLCHAQPSLL